MKLKSKRIKHYSGKVYDLTVENTHSYNIDGLAVHNSAAGSLVAFLIGITTVDPIKYNLMFERFHNKQKKAFPDIDCDFGDPEPVKNYIKEKYGKEYVAQISNWSTLSPKVVIKDVARSLEIGGDKGSAFKIANHLTSIMPDVHDIEDAVSGDLANKEFTRYMEQYPEVFEYSKKLQGLLRQMSVHAAGVVISDKPLYEIVPLRIGDQESDDGDGEVQKGTAVVATQWEKTRAEEFGLVKMDILGLNTLNIIKDTLDNIEKTTGIKLKAENIPIDDPETYKMISSGDNLGVFQLESSLSPLCMKIKPTDVETVAAINALGRPSCPPEQRKSYIARRFGKEKVEYTHPSLEPVLKDTYGISLYEESMMGIAKECAGWDLNEADGLRKLTKLKGKDPELALKIEANFLRDSMKNQKMTLSQASEVWEHEISAFSGYGFNRSIVATQKIKIKKSIDDKEWIDIDIEKIEKNSYVLSRNEKTKNDILIKILSNHYHGKLKVFRVKLDSGEIVECTINHKFRVTDGRMLPLFQILEENLEIVTKK